MSNDNFIIPNQDERLMAGLAHISAILPLIGVIVPIIIWVTQKEKSHYMVFQALQALAYQLIMIAAWFLGMGCYMLSIFGIFLLIFLAPAAEKNSIPLSYIRVFIPDPLCSVWRNFHRCDCFHRLCRGGGSQGISRQIVSLYPGCQVGRTLHAAKTGCTCGYSFREPTLKFRSAKSIKRSQS